jgi:hypothetical protein
VADVGGENHGPLMKSSLVASVPVPIVTGTEAVLKVKLLL